MIQAININDYSYRLPEERIARYPSRERANARLLVYRDGRITHTLFRDLPELLPRDHILVINNTRVIQARLIFRKESGARIEIFCLEPHEPADYQRVFQAEGSVEWKCLVGNARKWRHGVLKTELDDAGKTVLYAEKNSGVDGSYHIRFRWEPGNMPFSHILDHAGRTPIPPYLGREAETSDRSDYQTIYSKIEGSVAAPTAGFHFTDQVLDCIRKKGNRILETTLHIGAGTFRPVINHRVADHIMHKEHMFFSAGLLEELLTHKDRIIAVGTTTTRVLESLYWMGVKTIKNGNFFRPGMLLDQWAPYRTRETFSLEESLSALISRMEKDGVKTMNSITQLLIIPGYQFRVVNQLITNFHLPGSTLLLLIAAFTGNNWRSIYDYALGNGFRFLSYGDSSYLFRDPG